METESIWSRFSSSENLTKIVFVILLSVLLLKPIFFILGLIWPVFNTFHFSWVVFYIIMMAVIVTIYMLVFQRYRLSRSEVLILILVLFVCVGLMWKFNDFVPSNFAIEDLILQKQAVMSALGLG